VVANLSDEKTSAHTALTDALATYTQTDYTTTNWTALNLFKTDGDTAIDAATSLTGITSAKNTAITGMTGIVKDTTAPVITLIGANLIILEFGVIFTDPGATALDNIDGNITSNIVTVNPVDTGISGDYTITYNVKDGATNSAIEVTRLVTIKERPRGIAWIPMTIKLLKQLRLVILIILI